MNPTLFRPESSHQMGIETSARSPGRSTSSEATSLTRSVLPCSDAESARLERIHQTVGQSLFEDLQPLIKQQIHAEVSNLRLARYADFVTRALYPSCTITAHGTVSQHHVAWHSPPSTTAYLLDAMLGGGRYLPPPLHRPLTEIERRLLSRLAAVLWRQLETSWSELTAMQLETAHIDSEPHLRIGAANEDVLIVTWTLSNPFVRTMMQLLYPWSEVQAMIRQRDPMRQEASDRQPVQRPHVLEHAAAPRETPSDAAVKVEWTYTSLPAQDLHDLQVGDLLVTDVPPQTLARIFVDDHCQFHAHLGARDGRLRLRLEKP